MSLELKIKSKHLGEEAKIIRFEERKLLKRAKYLIARDGDRRFYRDDETGKWVTTELDKVFHPHWKLLSHRTEDVRNENRATFLARAVLKGQKFTDVERSTKDLGKLSSEESAVNFHLEKSIAGDDIALANYGVERVGPAPFLIIFFLFPGAVRNGAVTL